MTIPSLMRFIDHGSGGAPEVLRAAQTGVPVPAAGEVLVKVAYAGVNRPDCLQRSGRYPPPPGASPILGLEASGHVVALGEGVTQWKLGDAVCGLANGGAYAEYVSIPEGQALPIPVGLSLLQAAALPENYFTVWTNVFQRGRLQMGETFLVHGGSSGIGLTAIQLAKAFGAKVLCTVGNADKVAACLKAGADVAIDYRQQDFVSKIAVDAWCYHHIGTARQAAHINDHFTIDHRGLLFLKNHGSSHIINRNTCSGLKTIELQVNQVPRRVGINQGIHHNLLGNPDEALLHN